MSVTATLHDTSPPADAAARSNAARLLAGIHKGKPRRRPAESLTVRMPIDARTAAGRSVRLLRVRLLAHLGPKPSQAQLVLVEQLLQLKLRLAMMDHNFIAAGGKLSAHDSRTYLAWSNSLIRGLRELGLESAALDAPAPSLAEALAEGAQAVQGAARTAAPADAAPAARTAPTTPLVTP